MAALDRPVTGMEAEGRDISKWPWDSSKEPLSDYLKLIEALAHCGYDAGGNRNPTNVGISGDSLWSEFQGYCQVAKHYFEETSSAGSFPGHADGGGCIKLAEEAFQLIDQMLHCVRTLRSCCDANTARRVWDEYGELADRWDTLVRKWRLQTAGTAKGHRESNSSPAAAERWSRPMPLTDIADRILKDPKKFRKIKSVYKDRLKKIGDKSWQIRLDGLPANIIKELERP